MSSTDPRRRFRSHVASSTEKLRSSKVQSPKKGIPDIVRYGKALIHLVDTYQIIVKAILAVMAVVLFLFIVSVTFGGRIAPNVWLLDMPIGGLNYAEAETFAMNSWRNEIKVTISADNQSWITSPLDLGIRLDAEQVIQSAQGIGFAGIPFGYELQATFSFDESQANNYLLELGNYINTSPQNGSFVWRDNRVFAVPGVSGQMLDVEQAVQNLASTINQVVNTRQFEAPLATLAPDVYDSQLYLDLAERFVTTPFHIMGYDPFADTYEQWTTTPEQLASWLEANNNQLAVQSDTLAAFVDAINQQLLSRDQYIDLQEVTQAIDEVLQQGEMVAIVQIRNYPTIYEVIAGDTAYGISRKTGIPFFLIEEANSEIALDTLSPGDILKLPSRDVAVPLKPVANKRIIVDLETQSLAAYENGQEVFRWAISSGISSAPTSPGIYQILSHEPVAYGSSYTLCGETGCGQWELNWFMGLYEVVPGLVNGFHGAVLLPDGTYLGGNQVGVPYTLGCVMSREDQARLLYDWADNGTIVEIISDEFPPQSQLAIQFAMTV
jgi:L,D-transpeptidase catalytic domain/Putative peptidoglycan binding domain/LysM domain